MRYLVLWESSPIGKWARIFLINSERGGKLTTYQKNSSTDLIKLWFPERGIWWRPSHSESRRDEKRDPINKSWGNNKNYGAHLKTRLQELQSTLCSIDKKLQLPPQILRCCQEHHQHSLWSQTKSRTNSYVHSFYDQEHWQDWGSDINLRQGHPKWFTDNEITEKKVTPVQVVGWENDWGNLRVLLTLRRGSTKWRWLPTGV